MEEGLDGRVEQQQVAAPRGAAAAEGEVAGQQEARVADGGQDRALAPPPQNLVAHNGKGRGWCG